MKPEKPSETPQPEWQEIKSGEGEPVYITMDPISRDLILRRLEGGKLAPEIRLSSELMTELEAHLGDKCLVCETGETSQIDLAEAPRVYLCCNNEECQALHKVRDGELIFVKMSG